MLYRVLSIVSLYRIAISFVTINQPICVFSFYFDFPRVFKVFRSCLIVFDRVLNVLSLSCITILLHLHE